MWIFEIIWGLSYGFFLAKWVKASLLAFNTAAALDVVAVTFVISWNGCCILARGGFYIFQQKIHIYLIYWMSLKSYNFLLMYMHSVHRYREKNQIRSFKIDWYITKIHFFWLGNTFYVLETCDQIMWITRVWPCLVPQPDAFGHFAISAF